MDIGGVEVDVDVGGGVGGGAGRVPDEISGLIGASGGPVQSD